MIPEIGLGLLILAFVTGVITIVAVFYGDVRKNATLMNVGRPGTILQFVFVAAAFLNLIYLHLTNDFSVVNVFLNNHTLQPTIYKITAAWGNHEGSMLLWILILCVYGLFITFSKSAPFRLRALTLGFQAVLTTQFLGFTLFTSNPFARMPLAMEGRALNPLLQDPGIALHPPLLYLGYVGFSVVFSFALAGLYAGRLDALWASVVRPWATLAWTTLSAGITLGSYWAYYELGWGGFWFWDPVENASFMPWLIGAALLHSIIVMERRDVLRGWVVFLAIITFSLSLLGTFFVRSGILSSVHSFANDPDRGLVILLIFGASVAFAFILLFLRSDVLTGRSFFNPVSREGAIVLNNILLTVITSAVFIGTLYPMAVEAITGERISVGPPYFNITTLPLFAFLAFMAPLGQRLPWKQGRFFETLRQVWLLIALSGSAALLLFFLAKSPPLLNLLGIALGIFVFFAAFADLFSRAFRSGPALFAKRFFHLPSSAFSSALAHAGLGLLVIGVAATAFHKEKLLTARLGESLSFAGFRITFTGSEIVSQKNYESLVARFQVTKKGKPLAMLAPEKRFYLGQASPVWETEQYTSGFNQLYAVIGEAQGDKIDVHFFWKPWILFIWLGPALMTLAGALSFAQKQKKKLSPEAPSPSKKAHLFFLPFFFFALASSSLARTPDEALLNPELEKRAVALTSTLRCLVCQNQSIDESTSDFAKDLRHIIRERLEAGESEAEIHVYLVERYGEAILLKPPFSLRNALLWLTPFSILGIALLKLPRKSAPEEEPPLSKEERKTLAKMIRNEKEN